MAIRIDRVEGAVMAVNSYLVHGPDGLVVIDAQLTVSDARAVRAAVDAADAPLAAVVVTHPHPDHYAGAATLLDGLDAPLVATAGVDAVIRRDDDEKDTIVGPMMGAEWPATRRFPDRIVAGDATAKLGGIAFDVRTVGPAESHEDTLWWIDDRTVHVGDVVSNGMHAYLADGHHREWVDLLTRLHGDLDDEVRLLVGHGPPTDRSALLAQRDYLEAFVTAVSANLDVDADRRHDAVVARMREVLGGDDLLFLLEVSIEPVAARLAETG